jgi:hypothetical protein
MKEALYAYGESQNTREEVFVDFASKTEENKIVSVPSEP